MGAVPPCGDDVSTGPDYNMGGAPPHDDDAMSEHGPHCTGVLSPCGHHVGACACVVIVRRWPYAHVVIVEYRLGAHFVAHRLWVGYGHADPGPLPDNAHVHTVRR